MNLTEEKFIKFPGVNSVRFTHVIRSMLMVSKARWKEHMTKCLDVEQKGTRRKKADREYDWGFDELASMTGGFVGE